MENVDSAAETPPPETDFPEPEDPPEPPDSGDSNVN